MRQLTIFFIAFFLCTFRSVIPTYFYFYCVDFNTEEKYTTTGYLKLEASRQNGTKIFLKTEEKTLEFVCRPSPDAYNSCAKVLQNFEGELLQIEWFSSKELPFFEKVRRISAVYMNNEAILQTDYFIKDQEKAANDKYTLLKKYFIFFLVCLIFLPFIP